MAKHAIILMLLVSGCDSKEIAALHNDKVPVKLVGLIEDVEASYGGNGTTIHQFTFEGCEYLLTRRVVEVGITHKGNCSNPIHCHNKSSNLP